MPVSDSIVLEMLSRIQNCETEIKNLKEVIDSLKESQQIVNMQNDSPIKFEIPDEEEETVTRGAAREAVMEEIRKIKPNSVIRVATRNEGSGIFIVDGKDTKKLKFYYSKSYNQNSKKVISWSAVQDEDVVDIYDGYIFAIWANEKLYVLLFSHEQLINLIDYTNKAWDTNKKYHFSFTILEDTKVLETRGSIVADVSYSLNNYQII